MKYSIVIPTYNHCDDLLRPCLESVFKHSVMSEVEIIVSANGCTDNTRWYLESLKNQFDRIGFGAHLKVLWSDAPLGYPVANNVAIRHATADRVVLLNNDCILLDQEKSTWLKMLDSTFENPKCGISCVLKSHSEITGRDFAVFFCVMIDRKVFETVGLLNPEFGAGGCEDIEYCLEAENAGFEVIQCQEGSWTGQTNTGVFPIYHKGEGTVHDSALVKDWKSTFFQNQLKLAEKHNPEWAKNALRQAKDGQIRSSLSWMCENGAEAKELFDEVIVDNVYGATEETMRGREVIDIGANMGTFSILAASLGARKVLAIEPVTQTFDVLIKNVWKSGSKVIKPQKAVVSDKAGEFVKIGLQQKTGHNSLYNAQENFEEVYSVTLNNLLDMVDGSNVFLKMDCEGAEYDILMNASEEDMERITTIALEVHGDLHPKYRGIEVIQQKLESFGFTLKDRKHIGAWDIGSQGEMINYRDLGRTNEIWAR